MPENPPTPVPNKVEQEVRFAVVLYGGVSLAIYINGVVQEMLRLVRSTSPAAGALDPIEKVYRKLGQAIAPGAIPTQQSGPNDPIRTRFSIDVISGTSAGGINGIFLAKALANNAKLDDLQKLWFEQGALEKLLNDGKFQSDLPFPASPGKRSLLNSGRMYYELLQAFKGMDADAPTPPRQPLADQISLFATTTDIAGVPLPIQLSDEIVYERRYRNVFRLRYSPGNQFERARNDFDEPSNPFLAFAARCTSSFPFAFEPMRLADIDPILKCDSIFKARIDDCGSRAKRWQEFFREYLTPSGDSQPKPDSPVKPSSDTVRNLFANRAFGDGGYLNNKPFSYAIDALSESESDLPVERKLIYVEPSPEHPELEAQQDAPPNAVQNSIDALITIPGYQTIREDLARVLERNAIISRVNEAVEQIEDDAPLKTNGDGAQSNIQEFSWFPEPCLRQYYRLRATDVTNQLTDVIARAYSIEQGTAPYKCLRAVVHEWRVDVYETSNKKGIYEFLREFDLPYRLRRLRFLLRKLDAFTYSASPHDVSQDAAAKAVKAAKFSGASMPEKGWTKELEGARPVLVKAYRTLLALRRSLLSDEIPLDGAVGQAGAAGKEDSTPLAAVRGALGSRQEVIDFLKSIFPSETSSQQPSASSAPDFSTRRIVRRAGEPQDADSLMAFRARQKLGRRAENKAENTPGNTGAGAAIMGGLEKLGERLAQRLKQVLAQPEVQAVVDLLRKPRARVLSPFFTNFDQFDFTVFPILYGTPAGDSVPVEILRLSPEDVCRLQPDVNARRTKLKGLAVAHFGAFLDETWRENDLLWGRLDAAERLIGTLLPLESCETFRNQLIDEAQEAIIEDFGVQEKIRNMALARIAGKHPNVRLTGANANQIVEALIAANGDSQCDRNRAIMNNWCTIVPQTMDRQLLLEDVARASQIAGEILDGVSGDKTVPRAGVWLTRAGRVLWSMVELAVPRSAGTVIFHYWAQILYLIAILLILGGVLSAAAQLTQFGWSLLGLTFTGHMLNMWLTSFMNGPNRLSALKRTLLAIGLVAAIVLVILGVAHTWVLTNAVLGWAQHHPIRRIPIARLTPALVNVAFALAVPLLAIFISLLARLYRRAGRFAHALSKRRLVRGS